MKKILGLDLGTASIGWALVNEAENDSEQSSIIKLGAWSLLTVQADNETPNALRRMISIVFFILIFLQYYIKG